MGRSTVLGGNNPRVIEGRQVKATAIILNYQREPNVHVIIPALKRQTVDLHTVLVNNDGSYTPTCEDDTPDMMWNIPFNIGTFARWLVAYAYDGWLYIQDDDVMPTDDAVVEDLITLAMDRPDAITGMFCRNVHKQPPHYIHKDAPKNGATSYIKAISLALHRKTLGKVRLPPGDIGRGEDIYISLEIGRGEDVHYVSDALRRRMKHLPQLGVGLSHEPGHYEERDAFCGWWLRKEGLI